MAVQFDNSVLLGYFQAKTNSALVGGGATAAVQTGGTGGAIVNGKRIYAPTPPWSTTSGAAQTSELVKQALAGRRFINEDSAQLDLPGASTDYKKLFALYQGLNALSGIADKANSSTITTTELNRLNSVFSKGLSEISGYVDKLKLEQMRLTRGDTMLSDKSAVGVPRATYTYKTGKLHTGAQSAPVEAFQGDVKFDITVKQGKTTKTMSIDLSEMTGDRSMGGVASFINSKLEAEGIRTRFSVERTPGEPRKITTGGTTVTLPALADDYNFKISGDSTEQLTFTAAATKPAVYVTTYAGNPDPDKNTKTDDGVFENTLVKLDGTTLGVQGSKISSGTMEGTVDTVRKTMVGEDGSLYVLADVTGTVDSQTVKGQRDVALLKYDSAGKLMYARTLGAADSAEGLAMSIADDGRVAIAGKVTGNLNGAAEGPINSSDTSGKSDSFVTVFDAAGDEMWTQRRGAVDDDEATAVAFGEGGLVYVAGRTKSALPGGGGSNGGWDNYLMAVAPDQKGVAKTLFTQQFGTAGADTVGGIVVDGDTVTVAGTEDGRAVLRSWNVSPTSVETVRTDDNGFTNITTTTTVNGASSTTSVDYGADNGGDVPVKTTTTVHTSAVNVTAGATRDLGALNGGSIAGLAMEGGYLYIAGQTANGSLSVGNRTSDYTGGQDAFAARISTTLTDTSADNLAYFGGAANDTVAGMAVSNGKVYVVGQASADQPGSEKISTKDGYLAKIDVATGAVESQRVTGKDGYATATSIAVDANGASALDKLGLPSGTMLWQDSTKLTSATSLRAGDNFQIRTAQGGRLATVTIEANETMETLKSKVQRLAGFKAKVEVVADGEFRRLKITPAVDSATVEILPGKGGSDALEALGLTAGVVRKTIIDDDGKSVSADGKGPVFGIGLPTDLDLRDSDAVKNAVALLAKSLTKVRDAYRALETAAKPAVVSSPGAGGTAPAYLTSQIANYQAALNRLTGGG
ncbi:MAG: hypothetical protein KA105_00940 [Caulobacter sp.]|jgi:hypothetical protein|nr:hypothetical protein [Caulobacter sp.]